MLYEDQFVGQGLSCQQKRKINFYPFTHFILSSVKIGALHIMFSEREREYMWKSAWCNMYILVISKIYFFSRLLLFILV